MSAAVESRMLSYKCFHTGPVSLRDSNARQPFFLVMAPSSSAGETHRNPAKRQTTPKSDKEHALHQEQRRRKFLHKVREKGEDKKWDHRGQQILREDFLAVERHWIESKYRSAPPPLTCPEDEDLKDMKTDDAHDDGMIDQVLSQENEKVDALISLFEERSDQPRRGPNKPVDDGSDDEKYDSIFLDLLTSTSNEELPQTGYETPATEAMDMSGG
ncbi:MAG: hypothetical protein Q9168_001328 [Polycauliona sp. 1 TL-2023]